LVQKIGLVNAERISTERLRSPILRFLGVLAYPEFCALHGEADDASAGRRLLTKEFL
jgi:hypothetical protein